MPTKLKQLTKSPLREIRTAGSEWGDGHKKLCQLGEGTVTKVAEQQRGSAKATGFEARPYPPQFESCQTEGDAPDSDSRWADDATHRQVLARGDIGRRGV